MDSDIPSPVRGVLKRKLFVEDQVIKVGEPIAIIEVPYEESTKELPLNDLPIKENASEQTIVEQTKTPPLESIDNSSEKSKNEQIDQIENEIEQIKGSISNQVQSKPLLFAPGKNDSKTRGYFYSRIEFNFWNRKKIIESQKQDILNYLKTGRQKPKESISIIQC